MILNSPYISGSLTVTGNIIASGSITLSGSIASASYAASASNASAAQTASYVLTAQTASFVALAQSASNAVAAATASFANAFTVNGTLTAQTLVVQTITSSVDFVTGSTRFGSLLDNTHTFTGSLNLTGSLTVVTTGTEFQVNSTGVNLGNALTDSHIISGSVTMNPGGLFVSSSGNVGIGTISPSQKLEVVGGEIKAGRVDSTNEGGQLSFGRASDNNTTWYIDAYGSASSPQLRFVDVDNSAIRMIITGSNVGIGTAPPTAPLTIAVPAVGSAIGATTSQQAFDYSRLRIKHYSDSNLGLSIGYAGANLTYIQSCYNEGTTAPLLINPFGGNVGIGTSSPAGTLTVASAQNLSVFRSTTTTNYAEVQIENTTNYFQAGVEGATGNRMGGTIAYNSYLGSYANYGMTFHTNNLNRMTITSAGLIGIGTSSPNSNLQINGNNATVYDASVDSGQDDGGVTLTVRNNDISTAGSFSQINMMVSGDSGRALGRIVTIRTASATSDMAFVTERENAKSEKIRITSNGVLKFSSIPFNNYHLDTSTPIAVANGGTISFETFSGLVIINNMSNGNCVMWLCGAGVTSIIGQSGGGGATGTLSYSVGINGYIWTAAQTANYGVFAVRTRANA